MHAQWGHPPPPPYRGPAGAFVPPPPPVRNGRSPLAILHWFKLGFLVFIGLPCIGLVAWVIIGFERDNRRDLIVFDNRLDSDVDVAVDGKVLLHVEVPESHKLPVLALPEHAKQISVSMHGKVVAEATLAIPAKPKGQSNGYRGLFVVGAPRQYVVAKVPYSDRKNDASVPRIVSLATPTSTNPIVELPRDLTKLDIVDLDRKFYPEESVQQHTTRWVSRICTWDPTKGPDALGCDGYPGSPEAKP